MSWISKLATEALNEEVALDFKPGLVCKNTTGSHDDMDFGLFMISSSALSPHFKKYELIGKNHKGSPIALFNKLRSEGILAEESMFKATENVNTHKGANFIHSIIIGATSYLIENENSLENLNDYIKKMCKDLKKDFNSIRSKNNLTNGENIYLKFNHMGIREEAINGFPLLFNYPFSNLDNTDDSKYKFLLGSMKILFDTTIISRCGIEGLQWTQDYISTLTPFELINNFEIINKDFVLKRISPGGSADLLSAALLLQKIK